MVGYLSNWLKAMETELLIKLYLGSKTNRRNKYGECARCGADVCDRGHGKVSFQDKDTDKPTSDCSSLESSDKFANGSQMRHAGESVCPKECVELCFYHTCKKISHIIWVVVLGKPSQTGSTKLNTLSMNALETRWRQERFPDKVGRRVLVGL